MCDVARSAGSRASDSTSGRRTRARRGHRLAHAAARQLVDEGPQAEIRVGSRHDLQRCFRRRSSCCMASRRPARVGGGRRMNCAGRYRAITPDLPGHGQSALKTASFDACAAYVRALGRHDARRLQHGRADRALHRAPHARHRAAGAPRGEPRHRGRAGAQAAQRAGRQTRRSHRSRSASRPSRGNGPSSRCSPTSRSECQTAPTPTACATRRTASPTRCAASAPASCRHSGIGCETLTIPVTLITGERDEKFHALAEADAGSGYRTRPTSSSPTPGTPPSSSIRSRVAQAIYQSGSPSSSASA